MTFTVRAVRNQPEIDAIHQLYVDAFADEDPDDIGPWSVSDEREARQMIRETLAQSSFLVPILTEQLALYQGGELIGAVTTEIDHRTLNWVFGEPDDGQKAHRITALLYHSRVIGRIVVRPDRQGHGVGAALLRAMEERGLQRGVLWFCGIAVSEDSARFFRYNGYDVHGMETEGKPLQLLYPDLAIPLDVPGGSGFHKRFGDKKYVGPALVRAQRFARN